MASAPRSTAGDGRRRRRGRYAVAEHLERFSAIRQRAAADRREPARSGRHHRGGRRGAREAGRLLAEVGPNAVSHMLAKLPYDPHTAFTPIIHAANLPAVILIRPTLPYATLSEFIAAAKRQPGKFHYASAGLGNWTHLFMTYFNSQAGIDQVNVIYRSGAEMLTSLLRNDADTGIITVSTALGQIKEGKIRALAGAAMRPMPQLPDTPPAGQTIPGFDAAVWHGIVAPAGMDPELVTRINDIFNQVLQAPAVHAAITGPQAADIVGGTPQQFDTPSSRAS